MDKAKTTVKAGLEKVAKQLRVIGYEERRWIRRQLEGVSMAVLEAAETVGELQEGAKALAMNGNAVEAIWMAEFQRIAGPDATLSTDAQSRLERLRSARYAVTTDGAWSEV